MVNHKSITLFILLAAVAGNALALNLGRMRGAAIVGQPLDVTIQAQLSQDETPGSLCAEADVFHADTRQESSRVRVSVEGTSQQTANIRVTSSTPVDEPVVTVYLKAGCSQKITRRFVLLADVPTEPIAAPSLPLVAAPSVSAPTQTPPPASNQAASAGAQDAGSSWSSAQAAPPVVTAPSAAVPPVKRPPQPAKPRPATVKKAAPKVAKPAPPAPAAQVAKAAPAASAVPPLAATQPEKKDEKAPEPKVAASAPSAKAKVDEKAASEAGQSRLKLDPMVTLADRVANLEASTSAVNAPSTESAAREAQRVQTLEESVKTLVALAAKNEASMVEMRNRLQRAESERGAPMAWLYGMGGLLLACLGGLGYLLMRQNTRVASPERDDWWSASKSAPVSQQASQGGVTKPPSAHAVLGEDDAQASNGSEPHARTMKTALRPTHEDDPDVDVSLVEMSESNFDSLMRSGQAHGALRRGPLPPPVDSPATRKQPMDVARPVNSEQIFDIRQQADFFVSLGQTDQAVRILEGSINDADESSPLLYLDLLKIFQSLGLKQDYHQFREDFNLLFNSRVPEFANYANEGRSLEEYPQVLAHITALWPTPKALMVIEASIFRDPLDDKSKPFDLAAFRDLLLLHAIARSNERGDTGISGLAPLSTVPVSPQHSATMAVHRLDLDITGNASSGAKVASVDIALDASDSVMPQQPKPPSQGGDLDLDLSDLVVPGAKSAVVSASEEETEFPNLNVEVPAAPLPPLKKSDKPEQLIQDNHYLDFDPNPTQHYTLPKGKEPGKP